MQEKHLLIVRFGAQAVGMQAYIPDLSVILACDWLLGMFRTVVNIWGDGMHLGVLSQALE
jgi:Na+/H+-dicarboxylate symporter